MTSIKSITSIIIGKLTVTNYTGVIYKPKENDFLLTF